MLLLDRLPHRAESHLEVFPTIIDHDKLCAHTTPHGNVTTYDDSAAASEFHGPESDGHPPIAEHIHTMTMYRDGKKHGVEEGFQYSPAERGTNGTPYKPPSPYPSPPPDRLIASNITADTLIADHVMRRTMWKNGEKDGPEMRREESTLFDSKSHVDLETLDEEVEVC